MLSILKRIGRSDLRMLIAPAGCYSTRHTRSQQTIESDEGGIVKTIEMAIEMAVLVY